MLFGVKKQTLLILRERASRLSLALRPGEGGAGICAERARGMAPRPAICYPIRKMVSEPALVVYTRPDCSYSDALLHDLDKDGVEYRQVDLEERPDLVGELERLTGGERMTPVMVEGDLVIVGYHGVG